MLGDIIYEAKGKLTGYRVLDVAEGPKIEVTIAQDGTLKGGIEATDIVTYWSIPSPLVYYSYNRWCMQHDRFLSSILDKPNILLQLTITINN